MVKEERPQGCKAGISRRLTPPIREVADVRAALAGVTGDTLRVVSALPQAQLLTPRAT